NFVTLIVAASFTSADLENARNVLRGVALAQSALNQAGALPGDGRVQLQIASVGPQAEASQAIAGYFTDQIARSNPDHTIGIISWAPKNLNASSAGNLLQALNTLKQAQVPTILPVRTADAIPSNTYL